MILDNQWRIICRRRFQPQLHRHNDATLCVYIAATTHSSSLSHRYLQTLSIIQSPKQVTRSTCVCYQRIPSYHKHELGIYNAVHQIRRRERLRQRVEGNDSRKGHHFYAVPARHSRSERSCRTFWGGDHDYRAKTSHTEQIASQTVATHSFTRYTSSESHSSTA